MRPDLDDSKLQTGRPRKRESIPEWTGYLYFLKRVLRESESQPAVCLVVTEKYSSLRKAEGL